MAIDRGVRIIAFRPAPISSPSGPRSLGDPAHDRFWAMAAGANIVVAFHAADSGYAKYAADWGERTKFGTFSESPFAETLSLHVERPVFDTIAAMIGHGVFDRHPKLRVATVELGSGWVPELTRRLGLAYGKMPRAFGKDPVETFREHVWVAPFQEDSVVPLIDALGLEHVMLGSDWPHPEGLAIPSTFLEDIAELSPYQQRRIMSDNLRELITT